MTFPYLFPSAIFSAATICSWLRTVPDSHALWRIDPATGYTTRIPLRYYPWGVAATDDIVLDSGAATIPPLLAGKDLLVALTSQGLNVPFLIVTEKGKESELIQAFRLGEELSLPVMVCMDGFILTHAYERVDIPTQVEVDAYLPPFEPRQILDPAEPVTIGAMGIAAWFVGADMLDLGEKQLGMLTNIYNVLAGKYGFGDSEILSRDETLARLPTIEPEGLRGGVVYYDGQFDDSRLLINLLQTAAEQGATLLNYARVTGCTREADGFLDGVVAVDDSRLERELVQDALSSFSVVETCASAEDALEALRRAKLDPAQVEEVIMGNVLQAGLGQNVARQSASRNFSHDSNSAA